MMKAARYHAEKDMRVESTAVPSVNKKQVRIEVKYAGIRGTDSHEYFHGPILLPMKEPYLFNGHCDLTTMGHEFAGVVVEVGVDVNNNLIKIGDRVVVEPVFKNPDDPLITKGECNLPEPIGSIGLTANDGFAKYVVVEDYTVHKIPDNVSFEQGALVEPVVIVGDTCVIFGAGPSGLLCLQAAMTAGATRIIVVETAEERLKKARQLGATLVINGKETNVSEQVKDYTGGLGADVYIDAAGVQETFTKGVASLRKAGRAVIVALFGEPIVLNASDLVLREIFIKGSASYGYIFAEVIQLIANKQLDDIIKEGFESLVSDSSQIKILVHIDAD